MKKIYLDSQEQELLLKLYDNISLQLCLDIPPTKSLKDKNLIEYASVCNETIMAKQTIIILNYLTVVVIPLKRMKEFLTMIS